MKSLANTQLDAGIIDWPVYMRQALVLAVNVITTTPNPRVGCVLLNDKTVVGEGWHVAPGEAHAEVMALRSAGSKASGSTAFVSLEPCAHHGRTGPCANALIEAGVNRVVLAAIDPNPEVSGQGVDLLEAAGIEVIHLLDFEAEARAINPGYFKRRECGRPYVRCKLAMSLDGRTALANGVSKWITGPEARADVQRLRAGSSAILTGVNTVLADNPLLNVRTTEPGLTISTQPLRVILDSTMRTPGTSRIFSGDGLVKIFTLEEADVANDLGDNVEIRRVKSSSQRVNLLSVLESLAADYSCNEVLIEAGSTLSGAFINAELVDELIVYIAPKLLGNDAKALLDISGLQSMSESINFIVSALSQIGEDIRVTLRPA